MSNVLLTLLLLCVAFGTGWLWERDARLKANDRHRERMARLTAERNDAVYERELLEARVKSLVSHQEDLLRQKQEEYMQKIAALEREHRTNNVIAAKVFEQAKRRGAG